MSLNWNDEKGHCFSNQTLFSFFNVENDSLMLRNKTSYVVVALLAVYT